MTSPSAFRVTRPNAAGMPLFCLPYAGASARAFDRWAARLPSCEVRAYEPPGRGTRVTEPLCYGVEPLVDEVLLEMATVSGVYAVFGHSMGGLLAYRAVARMQRLGLPLPALVILSATSGPGRLDRIPCTTEAEVMARVQLLEGVPEAVWRNRDYLDFFVPILRADFSVCNSFAAVPLERLQSDALLCYGKHDPEATRDDLEAWARYVDGTTRTVGFTGGHFFAWQEELGFVEFLNRELTRLRDAAYVAVDRRNGAIAVDVGQ